MFIKTYKWFERMFIFILFFCSMHSTYVCNTNVFNVCRENKLHHNITSIKYSCVLYSIIFSFKIWNEIATEIFTPFKLFNTIKSVAVCCKSPSSSTTCVLILNVDPYLILHYPVLLVTMWAHCIFSNYILQ